HQREGFARPWQHLQTDVQDHAQRAHCARDEARQIVAGDVLHDLAAEAQDLAASVDDARAEHEIARGPRVGAARTGKVRRDRPAEGGRGAEMRRLEREHLALFGQQRFEFGQRRAGPRGEDQFFGMVVDDAAMIAERQRFALHLTAEEVLGTATDDRQRGLPFDRVDHARPDVRARIVRHGQNRSSSGNGNSPAWTCRPPYAAQRFSSGTALPGLSRPLGSNAALIAWNCVSSAEENWSHIWLIFSTPTPCSPVMVPPTSTHSLRISPPSFSTRSSSPGRLASYRIIGCRLPSPAWNTLATANSCLRPNSWMRRSTRGRCLRGMVPSVQ